VTGTVIRSTGSWYTVRCADDAIIEARIKGKFRLEELRTTNPVAVGDHVVLEKDEGDSWMITEIRDRENYIIRQSPHKKNARHIIAANLDQAFVIATMSVPRTSSGFIDRFLLTAEAYHIPATIIFNKQDIYKKKDLKRQEDFLSMYLSAGYACIKLSALEGEGVKDLHSRLKDKTTLFAGHSGVGKSTLINALIPDLELRTAEISQKYQKGRHTTTFAEMFELPGGGSIIDTPGIKEFGVLDFEPAEVSHYYPEMRDRLEHCQFNNCLHMNEPGCAIIDAVIGGEIHPERYKNYTNIVIDIQENSNSWER
jgi:ribosome biogenesis GTPase